MEIVKWYSLLSRAIRQKSWYGDVLGVSLILDIHNENNRHLVDVPSLEKKRILGNPRKLHSIIGHTAAPCRSGEHEDSRGLKLHYAKHAPGCVFGNNYLHACDGTAKGSFEATI